MYPQKTRREATRATRIVASTVMLGAVVAGCSDLYYDRRDTVALSAGDAVAANMTAQTIDPWPPLSGNPNIAFNGQRMQSAVERYRTNLVTPPIDPMMLQVANQTSATAQSGGPQAPASGSQSSSSSTSSGSSASSGSSGQ